MPEPDDEATNPYAQVARDVDPDTNHPDAKDFEQVTNVGGNGDENKDES